MKNLKQINHSPNFWVNFLNKLKLSWFLLKDQQVPFSAKLIPILVIVYIFSPIDILPDIFPLLGQVDDLTLIILGLDAFINIVPKQIVEKYRESQE